MSDTEIIGEASTAVTEREVLRHFGEQIEAIKFERAIGEERVCTTFVLRPKPKAPKLC